MLPQLSEGDRFKKELREWNKKIKILKDESAISKANKIKYEIIELTDKINKLHNPSIGYLQRPSLLKDDRDKLVSLRVELNQYLKSCIKELKLR